MQAVQAFPPANKILLRASLRNQSHVELRGLGLTSLPWKVCQPALSTSITYLDVSYNQLSALPQTVGDLSNLQCLYAHDNVLRSLPAEIARLSHLVVLDFSRNCIVEIPPALPQANSLEVVNFSGNLITLLIPELLYIPTLCQLHLIRNPIQNVPQDVVRAGLDALRKFFDIDAPKICTQRKSEPRRLSLVEQLNSVTLRSCSIREKDLEKARVAEVSEKEDPAYETLSTHSKCSALGCMVSCGKNGRDRCWSSSDRGYYSSSNFDINSLSYDFGAIDLTNGDQLSCHGDYDSEGETDRDSNFDETEEKCSCYHDNEIESDSDDDLLLARRKRLPDRTLLLTYKKVSVVIPEHNRSGHILAEFSLDILEDVRYLPAEVRDLSRVSRCSVHASSVVCVEPHCTEFYPDEPALITLPLHAEPSLCDEVICLCSQTSEGQTPAWERVPEAQWSYSDGKVTIKTSHFSLFTVIIQRVYPETKMVISTGGGTLKLQGMPGVEIHFPKGSVHTTMEASMKVLYADPPYGLDEVNSPPYAIATPVVTLGPHGYKFASVTDPVVVKLPIPDYLRILDRFGHQTTLSVWHSPTNEEEPLAWERLEVNHHIKEEGENHVICFPVTHFSWYRVLWDILATKMHAVKMGVTYFYPYTQFSMMCQALMQEFQTPTHTFGLEVICYRSGKPLPEIGNYQHRVGGSIKPRLMKLGDITVRLVSEVFEADSDAGEDDSLAQTEADFRGQEFDKSFACRFKDRPIDRGVFGKVFVERRVQKGVSEQVFHFNLTKSGKEVDLSPQMDEEWQVVALRELAAMLSITSEENWRLFAAELGFTRREVTKFALADDPFTLLLTLYQERGGTPEEFIHGLYEVSRKIRMGVASGHRVEDVERAGPGGSRSSRKRTACSSCDANVNKRRRQTGSSPRQNGHGRTIQED
ncbi:LRSAM1 [Branchiostoma lanceolatum]|uniref:LRSAM1 protein n=1 Tax=Branchiostoma lanceolatum TaxID=7740 RepID=A0A8S4MLP3_BRALA|nr:LRSAM1 [Branchiostoma lanceolatum]